MADEDEDIDIEVEEDEDDEGAEGSEAAAQDDVSLKPNETADDRAIVDSKIPQAIRDKYEIHSYRSAAVILAESRPAEFADLIQALTDFTITTAMIRKAGGNESEMPKAFSKLLRPMGWHETTISANLDVTLAWREPAVGPKGGKAKTVKRERLIQRTKYIDGHKVDYVKGKTAFDLEWNSKDQTFDRDLYAMAAFFQSGAIDVGVLVTRSQSLDDVFRSVGPALTKTGAVEMGKNGSPRPTKSKYGASTTWMGKLIYRLNAGRNAGCPILAVGITPAAVSDWTPPPVV